MKPFLPRIALSCRTLTFSTVLRIGAVLVLLSVLFVVGRPEQAQAQSQSTLGQAQSTRALPDKGFDLDTVGFQPAGIWSDGTTMWVADGIQGGIRAYRLSDGARDASSDFALDGYNTSPTGIWSDNEFMWVVDLPDKKVYVYNLATKERVADREFDLDADNGMATGAWSDGQTIWIIDSGWDFLADQKLYAYDLASGGRQKGKEFALDSANNRARDLWSDGTTVWISDRSDGKLYAYGLDGGARQSSKDIQLLSDNDIPSGVWSDGTTMWVAQVGFRQRLLGTLQLGVIGDKVFAYDVSDLTAESAEAAEAAEPAEAAEAAEPAASFVIYHDPDAGARAVGRYNRAVALLADAGISYREVTGDVRADVDRLAGVSNSVMPRFFLGDPTASDWTSQPKVNNGGLRWLRAKAAELSDGG